MAEQAISRNALKSAQNLKILAFKPAVASNIQAGVREGLNKLADSISHFAMEQFKPQISQSVQTKVNNKFN
jgi:hypothetical protein